MKHRLSPLLPLLAALAAGPAAAVDITPSLESYRAAGAAGFDAARGEALWRQEFDQNGETRSCTTCHGADLTQPGRQANTGKPIEAMAPSVNPQRLTDTAKIEKWFTRNCKWTLGRECSPQEKGEILLYLSNQ